ncbi:MAG: hypothetical protein MJY78_07605 [Fibrobacter sp.]|nr:hypothetical protein [Fibrobacter sp.]
MHLDAKKITLASLIVTAIAFLASCGDDKINRIENDVLAIGESSADEAASSDAATPSYEDAKVFVNGDVNLYITSDNVVRKEDGTVIGTYDPEKQVIIDNEGNTIAEDVEKSTLPDDEVKVDHPKSSESSENPTSSTETATSSSSNGTEGISSGDDGFIIPPPKTDIEEGYEAVKVLDIGGTKLYITEDNVVKMDEDIVVGTYDPEKKAIFDNQGGVLVENVNKQELADDQLKKPVAETSSSSQNESTTSSDSEQTAVTYEGPLTQTVAKGKEITPIVFSNVEADPGQNNGRTWGMHYLQFQFDGNAKTYTISGKIPDYPLEENNKTETLTINGQKFTIILIITDDAESSNSVSSSSEEQLSSNSDVLSSSSESQTVVESSSSVSSSSEQQKPSSSASTQPEGTCYDKATDKFVNYYVEIAGANGEKYAYKNDCSFSCYHDPAGKNCEDVKNGTSGQQSSSSEKPVVESSSSVSSSSEQQKPSSSSVTSSSSSAKSSSSSVAQQSSSSVKPDVTLDKGELKQTVMQGASITPIVFKNVYEQPNRTNTIDYLSFAFDLNAKTYTVSGSTPGDKIPQARNQKETLTWGSQQFTIEFTIQAPSSSSVTSSSSSVKSSSSQVNKCYDKLHDEYVGYYSELVGPNGEKYAYTNDCSIECWWDGASRDCEAVKNASGPIQQSSNSQQQSSSSVSSSSTASSNSQQGGGSLLPKIINSNVKHGYATRYWDSCKPHCAWSGNSNPPARTCLKDGITRADAGAASICDDGGVAGTCFDQTPQIVNDTIAYAFAASPGGGNDCGKCYMLTFTGEGASATNTPTNDHHRAIKGKHLIIMSSNIGYDVANNQFDLMIPGGGPGIYNACDKMGISCAGEQYGGFLASCGYNDKDCLIRMCNSEYTNESLRNGCLFLANWMDAANNPEMEFVEVECPQALKDKY